MKNKFIRILSFFLSIPLITSGINFLYGPKNNIRILNNQKASIQELKNRMLVTIFVGDHIVDVSDLNITEQDVLNVWTSFEEKLYSLFPFLNLSTTQSVPPTFLEKDGQKIITINASFKDYDKDETKKLAVEMANNFYKIIKYAPLNTKSYNYPYYIYQRIVDWYTYRNTKYSHYLFYGLTSNIGVCEAYSRLSLLMFNSLNINASFISGVIKGSNPGPHVWNQYEINGNWYNFDSTFGDGFASTSSDIKSTPANPQYIAFPNGFQPSTREYYNNWWKPYYNADIDMAPYVDYVPYNSEISKSRKYPFNDEWYFIKDNKIIKSDINYQSQQEVYTFNDANQTSLGVWGFGDKLLFIDKNNSKYQLNAIDLNNMQLSLVKEYDSSILKAYLNNDNEMVIETNSLTDKVTIETNYDFLEFNSLTSIKSLAIINSLWLNSIQIGRKENQLTKEKLANYLSKLESTLYTNSYSDDLKQEMINFRTNVNNDLNQTDLPDVIASINNSYDYTQYDNVNITPTLEFQSSNENDYSYIWQKYENNSWVDTEYTNRILNINQVGIELNNVKFRLKCQLGSDVFYSNQTTLIVNPVFNITINLTNSNIVPFEFVNGTTIDFNVETFTTNNEGQKINLSNNYNYNLYLNGKLVSQNNGPDISYSLSEEDAKNNIISFYVEIISDQKVFKSNTIEFNKTPLSSISYNGIKINNNNEINVVLPVNNFSLEISLTIRDQSVNTNIEYNNQIFNLTKSDDGLNKKFTLALKENKIINSQVKLYANNNLEAYLLVESTMTPPSIKSNNNLGMILGISIPVALVLASLIIFLIVFIMKKNKK